MINWTTRDIRITETYTSQDTSAYKDIIKEGYVNCGILSGSNLNKHIKCNPISTSSDFRLVNIVKLATDLASEQVYNKYGDSVLVKDKDSELTRYTPMAQSYFDCLFDNYYNTIERCM